MSAVQVPLNLNAGANEEARSGLADAGFIGGNSRRGRKMLSKPGTANADSRSNLPVYGEEQWQASAKEDLSDDLPLETEEKIKQPTAMIEENLMGAYVPSSSRKSGARPRTAASAITPIRNIAPKPTYTNKNVPPHKEEEKTDLTKKNVRNTINRSGEQPETSQSFVPTNTTLNKDLVKELEESRRRVQELTIELEKEKAAELKAKEELRDYKSRKELAGSNELMEMRRELNNKHNRKLEYLKAEYTALLETERESWKKEKRTIEELHKLDMESLERQHRLNITRLRKHVELECEASKNQLQHETELAKLTAHVDSLTSTIRAKLENEMKAKLLAVEQKQAAIDDMERKNELERAKVEGEKKRAEEIERLCKEKEKQMQKEMEEYKELYKYQRESLDEQYKDLLRELSEKREKVMMEGRELEAAKFEVERLKKALEIELEKERIEVGTEKKVLDKRKQELELQIEKETKQLKDKIADLNAKKEELVKEQTELLRKQETWSEREEQLRRDSEELELSLNKYALDQRLLDAEKERVRKVALQVEEESRTIYNYKTAIGKTRAELEEIKAEVDTKESAVRDQKAKVEYEQKDLDLRLSAFEKTQLQYLKKPIVNVQVTMKSMQLPRKTEEYQPPHVNKGYTAKKVNSSFDSFKASDFIKDMHRNFGTQASFTDYMASERNFIRNPKYRGESRVSQQHFKKFYNISSVPAHIEPLTSHKNTDRYANPAEEIKAE
eukprot:TRINITY_DN8140_c0_g1_i6.p1 TRINITY_DN8140_c0_g1~~TRINITY_DN8140_c0_g1_i6.p1  ORF type:complete len:730 (-),score=197.73 TRINITY_DN8140_c0_g1_i6:142-2331(-)